MRTLLSLTMLGVFYCGIGTAFADDVPDASKTPGLAQGRIVEGDNLRDQVG